MKNVLIAGGSGLVGKRLSELLEKMGYSVSILSRKDSDDKRIINWDPDKMKLNPKSIEKFNHIIQLAGTGIADEPWTENRKKEILDSRVNPTKLLARAIAANKQKPNSFISASAVGFYGFVTSEKFFTEEDEAGKDFLGETCRLWENSINEIRQINVPTVIIRIGIVLSKNGGALKEIAKPIKYGFGAALGSGKQYVPWIHIDDLCYLFIYTIEKNLEGTFNAAAPNQVNNITLTKSIAKVLKKPLWLPNVPSFVINLILGKRKDLILEGSRVSIKKILERGFKFKYQTVEQALKNIYS